MAHDEDMDRYPDPVEILNGRTGLEYPQDKTRKQQERDWEDCLDYLLDNDRG